MSLTGLKNSSGPPRPCIFWNSKAGVWGLRKGWWGPSPPTMHHCDPHSPALFHIQGPCDDIEPTGKIQENLPSFQ